jgi:Fur family peroxide stress response transcriptional regulator
MQLKIVNDSRRAAYARERMAEFAVRCRAAGLPVTPQRMAIIEALLGATDHPRAEKICAEVRRRHPHVSLATVHRTLETLCRIGEARKVTALHDSARYDGNLEPHHHVVCVRCRRIRDVEIAGLDATLGGAIRAPGFKPLGWSLEIQAICDDCANSGERAGRSSETGGVGKTPRN